MSLLKQWFTETGKYSSSREALKVAFKERPGQNSSSQTELYLTITLLQSLRITVNIKKLHLAPSQNSVYWGGHWHDHLLSFSVFGTRLRLLSVLPDRWNPFLLFHHCWFKVSWAIWLLQWLYFRWPSCKWGFHNPVSCDISILPKTLNPNRYVFLSGSVITCLVGIPGQSLCLGSILGISIHFGMSQKPPE